MLSFLLLAYSLCSVTGYKFPAPDPKCTIGDFDCFAKVVSDMLKLSVPGIPEIGAVPLDPLHQPLIEEELADLKYSLTDSVVTGMKDAKVNGVSLVYRKSMHLDITIPYYEMNGNYKISGNLLGKSVEGQGKYFYNASNVNVVIDTNKEYWVRDGKLYSKFTNITTKTETLEDIHFDVENLFGGNKALADPVMKFVNDNAKAVSQILQEPVALANMRIVFDDLNKMLEGASVSEISLDEAL